MMIDTASIPQLVGEIRQLTSLEKQINALKLIKHDIVGNQFRKAAWKNSGVLSLLADILVSPSVSSTTWRGDEGKLILHAVTIVGSLVYGEPESIEAVEAAHMYGGLVRALEAVNVNGTIATAALRALNNIADAISRRIQANDEAFAAALYSDNGQKNLVKIIFQNSVDNATSRQITLAARLLAKTCTTEARQNQAVGSGCLEALTVTVARYVQRMRQHRSPGPSGALSFVLRAIAGIVSGSRDRLFSFAYILRDNSLKADGTYHRSNGNGLARQGSGTPQWGGHRHWVDVYPMGGWLLYLIKKETGSTRLMAIWVLSLYACGPSSEANIESGVDASLVPLLVQMLEQSPDASAPAPGSDLYPDDERQLMAAAPRVLALLISEETALQEAAYEAGAVAKLAKLARQANEAVPKDRSKTFWSASKAEVPVDRGTTLPQALCDQWKHREAVLQALAAIASQNDDYRRAVVESGAVAHIVACLTPLDPDALIQQQQQATGDTIRGVGNPVAVLLAACEAAKALSRSVSTLRTSLVDANLAAPLSTLLKHPDLEVKIAATAVVCNIVLEFSPMRQAAVDAGVIQLLCGHANSSDARLKLNSLWALKHVVNSAPNALKMQCIDELGSGWLTQALERASGAPQLPSIASLTGEGPGLFARQYDEDEVDMIDDPSAREHWEKGHDDIAIREQALAFVRNLIAGDGNAEMVDYMMQEIGQDRLFDMLANLLPPARSDSEVTLAVLYIICNLAAGTPRHRQILVSQSNLLRLVLPLFQHARSDIRAACVWLVINLTWAEDHEDRLNCKARAYELRKLGLQDRLELLADDSDLDVRERTKTAVHQLHELLR